MSKNTDICKNCGEEFGNHGAKSDKCPASSGYFAPVAISWYASKTGNHQGLVIEEGTGRNVAVTYEEKDAKAISLTPRMVEALNKALEELEYLSREAYIKTIEGGTYIDVDDTLVRELWAIKSELESE